MINKKLIVSAAGLLMAAMLAGCTLTVGAPLESVTEEPTESASEVISEDTPSETEETPSETEIDDSEAPSESGVAGMLISGELSLAQSIGPDGCAVFEVTDLIFITPEDTDLIEKYGFAPDLDGYDYEVVYSEDGPQMFTAFEDCAIEIIKWDEGESDYSTISLEEFCDYLANKGGAIQVKYEADDLGTITYIMEDYAG